MVETKRGSIITFYKNTLEGPKSTQNLVFIIMMTTENHDQNIVTIYVTEWRNQYSSLTHNPLSK